MRPERRRQLLRVAGWTLALIILVRVGASLADGLRQLRDHPADIAPRWGYVVLSGGVFLLAHATLVLTWRAVLSCWDARLPFWTAARIWSVSNLGRYLPGKIWQIGATGAMARQVAVSPVAASGSALLGTLVNILAGFVVSAASGRALLDRAAGGNGTLATSAVAIACVVLFAAPFIVPRMAPLLGRAMGRPLQAADGRLAKATFPVRAVVYAMIGNVIAWVLYGFAFRLFVTGVVGTAAGPFSAYLATYTISYVVGYIVLFAPAGIGVREGAMLQMLQLAGLATYPQATLITIGSRVWLTLLEVMPALFFWMHHTVRLRSPTIDHSDAPT